MMIVMTLRRTDSLQHTAYGGLPCQQVYTGTRKCGYTDWPQKRRLNGHGTTFCLDNKKLARYVMW